MPSQRLQRDFYRNDDVVSVAKSLLGKVLVTRFGEITTSGIITETEAYAGVTDRASHAWGGRFTERTRTMYEDGGTAYVYLCYGIHFLFNVVTHGTGTPHAVLIRGIFPLEGTETMIFRRSAGKWNPLKSGSGPGNVSKCLGIGLSLNGTDLCTSETIWIEDRGYRIPEGLIECGPRIGVDYAGEDARLPYRFFVSGKNLKTLFQAS